jgi:hypothetical protein
MVSFSRYFTVCITYHPPLVCYILTKIEDNLGEKGAGYVQAILAAIQFRMLHVPIIKTDIVSVILCGSEIVGLKFVV